MLGEDISIGHGHWYSEDLLIGGLDAFEVEGFQMFILSFLCRCIAADVGTTILLGGLDALLRPELLQVNLIPVLFAGLVEPRSKGAILPTLMLLGFGISVSFLRFGFGEVV